MHPFSSFSESEPEQHVFLPCTDTPPLPCHTPDAIAGVLRQYRGAADLHDAIGDYPCCDLADK